MDKKSTLRIASDADAANGDSARAEQGVTSEPTAKASAPISPGAAAEAVKPVKKRKRSLVRPLLFALLPVALGAGGYYYVTGGQVVSTENAYVQADILGITTDISGLVRDVRVRDNEQVKKGDVLVKIDPAPFQIALDAARAQLGVQRNQIENLKASYRHSLSEITQAESELPYYQQQVDRQSTLAKNGSASKTSLDQARHDLDVAKQKVAVAKAEAAATLAQLGGSAHQPAEQNPLYQQASAQVEKAERDLEHTVLKAPFDGIVTNVSSLQVGAYLQAAQQAFSLVSTSHLWVATNPKETELTYIRPGQDADVYVDAYPDTVWKGKVESISPASGSSFSLLPAQNSTGNWVKVVQRIPMLVSIEVPEGKPPLRVGMSTVVEVDTGHARGLPGFVKTIQGWLGRS